jgi:hypothetical protein
LFVRLPSSSKRLNQTTPNTKSRIISASTSSGSSPDCLPLSITRRGRAAIGIHEASAGCRSAAFPIPHSTMRVVSIPIDYPPFCRVRFPGLNLTIYSIFQLVAQRSTAKRRNITSRFKQISLRSRSPFAGMRNAPLEANRPSQASLTAGRCAKASPQGERNIGPGSRSH